MKDFMSIKIGEPQFKTINTSSLERNFKTIIQQRINHCEKQYNDKIDENTYRNESIIYFSDGTHFSIPVYKFLKEALNKSMQEWNRMVWQQIVRQMYNNVERNETLFNIATEYLLVKE